MSLRFEKSLYDLIRGLRNHKGNEKEYIQTSLKECRSEIRSQDMGWSPDYPYVPCSYQANSRIKMSRRQLCSSSSTSR